MLKLKYQYFAVDFDNTIAYDAYPKIGDLIPGAKETLELIKDLGGHILIWTCRTDKYLENAIAFLDKNKIPYDCVNESFSENVNFYGGDTRKCYADVYIDDRCILWKDYGGVVDWNIVRQLIIGEA